MPPPLTRFLLRLAQRANTMLALAVLSPVFADEAPLVWMPPKNFPADADKLVNRQLPLGLGMPRLHGIDQEILYDPIESTCAIEDGGDGHYESLLHGTYNHHATPILYGDKVIVFWTNHAVDENAPGQRLLARWGQLNTTRDSIDWGGEDHIFEITPQALPVRRRTAQEPRADADLRYMRGAFENIGGTLRSAGTFSIRYGWTDDMLYRTPGMKPIPDEHFRPLQESPFNYDMLWNPGPRYAQFWDFDKALNTFTPTSPLYITDRPPARIQYTESGRYWRPLRPLSDKFEHAPSFEEASRDEQRLFKQRDPHARYRVNYRPGTAHIAANGKNGLAHHAEFLRPDGTRVIIRDNLQDRAAYFGAVARGNTPYPPAVKTKLYGYAQPEAGNLPDGRAWIIGNSFRRYDFYLTTAKDGIHFDRSWRIYSNNRNWKEGFGKPKDGGPQYPHAFSIGYTTWVFYSIGKQQIAVTRIPMRALDGVEQSLVELNNPFHRAERNFPQTELPLNDSLVLSSQFIVPAGRGNSAPLQVRFVQRGQNYTVILNPGRSPLVQISKDQGAALKTIRHFEAAPDLPAGTRCRIEIELTRCAPDAIAIVASLAVGHSEKVYEFSARDSSSALHRFSALQLTAASGGQFQQAKLIYNQVPTH